MTLSGEMLVIHADGTETLHRLSGEPALETLQQIVGGYIEAVPFFRFILRGGRWQSCIAFCNEEAKIRSPIPSRNPRAIALWNEALSYQRPGLTCAPDYLVGDVAIVYGDKAFMDSMKDDGE